MGPRLRPHQATFLSILIGLRFAHEFHVDGDGDVFAYHGVRSTHSKIFAIDRCAGRRSDVAVSFRVGHGSAWAVDVQRDFFSYTMDGEVAHKLQLPSAGGLYRLRFEGNGWILCHIEIVGTAKIVIAHR